jgi:glycosyltransferase involved in cell wall biosynthesis
VRARFASMGTRAPVITSLVNVPYTQFRFQDPRIKPKKLRMVQMIDSWTSRFLTNHFHAVSDSVKQAAVNDLKIQSERITVIERGRDSVRLGKPARERRLRCRLRLGLHEEQKVLVTVGRQDYQKGQSYLMEAMSRLMPDYPDLILLLVGHHGAVSGDLEELCQTAKLDCAVRSLGYRQDVPDILAAADIFVFPSLFEGLPGAVIEAMALGLPIVGSDIPSMREVVEPGKNALLIPAKSSAELAQSIHSLLMNPEKMSEMGIRSREIFEERFTMEKSASRMIELFHQVAAAG